MKRYDNKTCWILQGVFAAFCLIAIGVLAWLLISYIDICLNGGGAESGIGLAFIIVFGVIAMIASSLLAIPFILLMVFCKKPWVALGVFVVLALLVIATLVVFNTVHLEEAETALCFIA